MKYTTPYSHQRQQILARILLTLWLPITCSPEPTFATSRSGSPEAKLATSRSGSPGSATSTSLSFVDLTPGSSGIQAEPPQALNVATEEAPNVAAAQLLHAAVEQGDLARRCP